MSYVKKNTQLNAYRTVGSDKDFTNWKNSPSQISALMEELNEEKDNNNNLRGKLSYIKGKLAKTQKLLREYTVKKTNWWNYYRDLQNDYYKGLDVHLERIYWLEDQCRQLSQSSRYYRKTACSKDA